MFTWTCPVCTLPLTLGNKSWHCENKHNFDCAKSGYTNLLLPQHKASKHPGDSREMLLSRREFLNAGHYQPVANTIASVISSSIENKNASLLDCGCGEGYYLHYLKQNLKNNWITAGLDIAKEGVNLAAKSYPESHWVCTSSARLPVADKSVNVLLRVFAPGNNSEEHRALTDNGLLIIVGPGEKHLYSIKEALYNTVKPYAKIKTPDGFIRVKEQEVNYSININNNEEVKQLLSMTPFFWKGKREARELLLQKNTLTTQVHMVVYCYEKD